MPDGLAAARRLGIQIEAFAGYPFGGIRFREAGITASALFPHGRGLGLRRTTLHAALVKRAEEAGVRLAWGRCITGIGRECVRMDGATVKARWVIGADGGQSRVRRWAGLEAAARHSVRYGFRRHYRVAPWSEYMEIHWGRHGQLYVTPIAADELCVVAISRDPHWRLENALPEFPELARRLGSAEATTLERGSPSVTRRLKTVYRDQVALIGDASGSVDAITGEGLCLLFQQAVALADALAAGDLVRYQQEHRRIGRRPEMMSDLMLLLERRHRLRRRTLTAFSRKPELFEGMLALHVGKMVPAALAANGLSLGWEILRA